MPNFQTQGKGSLFVCCGRSGASALSRGFCGRREGLQAASGYLSLPGPRILMSNTSDSFLERWIPDVPSLTNTGQCGVPR